MKRLIVFIGIIGAFAAFAPTTASAHAMGGYGIFDASLSPYGKWMDCSYGHVWRPVGVDHGWRPYLYGRWMWTDYGWYWLSDEPFGWATFHYGRWQYDDYYGWIWVPDDVWGPAWVEWRYDNDYIGWAPLSISAHFSFSFGMRFDADWVAPIHYWNFVPCRSFTSRRIVDYVQPVERTRRFFGNTRGTREIFANGDRIVNRGVDVGFIERRSRTRIERTEVVTRQRGEGERMVRSDGRARVEVYRPSGDASVRDSERRSERSRDIDRSEQSSRRSYEVQRNSEQRREIFENKEQLRDNRVTDPQQQRAIREPRPLPRRQIQIERRNEALTPERRMSVGRETQTSQRRETQGERRTESTSPERRTNSNRESRQPEQRERQQNEQRPRGRRP